MTTTATRARGTIIKVPDATPGLLMIGGQQLAFTLEGRWKSPVAPVANMTVEVDLDSSGGISALNVVDAQQLAKERLEQFGGMAQQHGKEAAAIARQGVGALAARMGTAALVAGVAIWVAWFFLPALSVEFFLVARSFTFWEILGLNVANLANGATSDHGLFAFLGILAIAAPFARPFVVHPQSRWLNAAPLGYLVLALLSFVWRINSAFDGQPASSELARGVAREMASAVWEAISIGAGVYVLLAASIFLAYKAVRASA
jgi:hypothetical protein